MAQSLSPQEQKLLNVFVREALSKPGSDSITTAKKNVKTVQRLRELGFLDQNEDSVTKEAFLQYVETFEKVTPPPEVLMWVERFGISDLRWLRFDGRITRIGQGIGKAYPLLSTIFIGEPPLLETWFHELAHVVFPRLDKQLVKRLDDAMRERYPVVTDDKVPVALDPLSHEETPLPKGRYLKINGQYLGLDHSEGGAASEDDEMWSHAFALYCIGFEFPPNIKDCLKEMIEYISGSQSAEIKTVDQQL